MERAAGATIKDLKDFAARSPQPAYRRAGYKGQLKQAGNNLVGLCPFHDERVPSFKIALQDSGKVTAGHFKCFGCRLSGRIIDFRLRQLNSSDLTAEIIKDLARDLGVDGYGHTKTQSSPTPASQEPHAPICQELVDKLHNHLLQKRDRLQKLLETKGLPETTVSLGQIGWDGERYTIPIPDGNGGYSDIR